MAVKGSDNELLECVTTAESQYRYFRYGHERDWYRNLLYKQGIQWIIYDEVGRRFRQKKLKSWIPTPCTNRFASTLDALVALILRVEPTIQWSPDDSSDEIQKCVAETATKLLDHAKDKTQFKEWRQIAATWLIYTGNVHLINMYDPKGGSEMTVPLYQCEQCKMVGLPSQFESGCPECESQQHGYAFDQNGTPMEESFKTGALRTEVGTPFECFFDFAVWPSSQLHDFLRIKERPLDYYPKMFGARGKKVQAAGSYTLSEFYASTLAYASSGSSLGASAALSQKREGAAEKWYVRKPDDDYPDGLYLIVAGDVILEKSNLPTKGFDGEPFLPHVHIVQDVMPGSALGKSVANDLAPKQKQRNELESLIQLITMRMANPVWIVPYGTSVEGFSGQPGAVLKVMQLSPNANNDPKRLPGENVPSSVIKWLEQIDKDFEDLASVYDVLKGQAPPGISAGYAIQLLIERGHSRWGPLFQRWENGYLEWARQVTAMMREHMPTEEILMILGPHGTWEAEQFKGGNEDDPSQGWRHTLVVEAGSLTPHSALAENAQVDQAIGAGLIDMSDPKNKAEILRSRGLAKYDRESDWDLKDAAREEQGFLLITKKFDLAQMEQQAQEQAQMAVQAGADPAMVQQNMQGQVKQVTDGAFRFRQQIDNHPIHLWSHKRFAKTDEFLKLSPQWQAALLQHMAMHAQIVMMESQQMLQQAGGGMPPGGKPPSGGGPPKPPGAPGEPSAFAQEQPNPGGGVEPNVAASAQGGHRPAPEVIGG